MEKQNKRFHKQFPSANHNKRKKKIKKITLLKQNLMTIVASIRKIDIDTRQYNSLKTGYGYQGRRTKIDQWRKNYFGLRAPREKFPPGRFLPLLRMIFTPLFSIFSLYIVRTAKSSGRELPPTP